MGNESIDTNEVRRLFGANLSFLEYRWQCHEDFVKYALKYCIIPTSENAMEKIVKF